MSEAERMYRIFYHEDKKNTKESDTDSHRLTLFIIDFSVSSVPSVAKPLRALRGELILLLTFVHFVSFVVNLRYKSVV